MRSGNKKSRKGGRKGKTGKKSGQRKAAGRQSVQVIGVDCEYVVLEDLINNPSCTKGQNQTKSSLLPPYNPLIGPQ